MSDTAFVGFLGDREHTFVLTPKLITELERVSGAGIGTLFKRMTEACFSHADIINTIRLGLIGGGANPEQATRLCETYVAERPIKEAFPLALSILERLWFGAPVINAAIAELTKGESDEA